MMRSNSRSGRALQ